MSNTTLTIAEIRDILDGLGKSYKTKDSKETLLATNGAKTALAGALKKKIARLAKETASKEVPIKDTEKATETDWSKTALPNRYR